MNGPEHGAPRKPHATGGMFHMPHVPPMLLIPIRLATREERDKTAAGWTGDPSEARNGER